MKLGVTSTSIIQECHCNDIKSVVSNNEIFVLYHYLLFMYISENEYFGQVED